MTFDGFISYSHAADRRLAPAIQHGLHRLAKPWHRRRALWIFRDQTGLSVTPALWTSIQNAMDKSGYFVLLASPEAANSPWVNKEIEHWLATKSPDRVLPVVTEGDWQWDPVRGDFTDDSTAVPDALRGAFAEEPLYLDMRWARDDLHLSLRHTRFRDAIAQLAAPMHGLSKDDLEGEDVRQHRRVRMLRTGALVTLTLLTFVAVLTGMLAVRNAARANASATEAHAQQRSALVQRTNAERFAQDAQEQQKRATEAAAETKRQEGLAAEQRKLAAQASIEADKQEALANDQRALAAEASADAKKQEKNARQNQQLAARAQDRALAQEKLADKQRALANRWAAEAATQEKAANDATAEAGKQQRLADRQQQIAVGRRLFNQAKETMDDDPVTALKLGEAADKVQNDAESHAELASLAGSTRYAATINGAGGITAGSGSTLSLSGDDGTVTWWDVADSAHPKKVDSTGIGDGPTVLSPDHRLAASVADDETFALWNVADRAHPVRLGSLSYDDTFGDPRMAFSPDGKLAITSSMYTNPPPTNPPWGYDATLWDISDPTQPTVISTMHGGSGTVAGFSFSADAKTVVVSTESLRDVWDLTDRTHPTLASRASVQVTSLVAANPMQSVIAVGEQGRVTLWKMTDPARPFQASAIPAVGVADLLAFSPDGRTLAVAATGTGTVTLWNVAEATVPTRIADLSVGDRYLTSLGFSGDGDVLAAAAGDVTLVWNTEDYGVPKLLTRLKDDRGGWVLSVDGDTMVTSRGADGTIVFWDDSHPADPVRRTVTRVDSPGYDEAVISSDRHLVVTARDLQPAQGVPVPTDGPPPPGNPGNMPPHHPKYVVTLTDVRDPAHPKKLSEISMPVDEAVDDLALRPDAKMVAIVGQGSPTVLWDLSDPAHPRPIATTDESSSSASFTPDGRTLILGASTGAKRLDVSHPDQPARKIELTGVLSFSADAQIAVTKGNAMNSVVLWNIADPSHPDRLAMLTGLPNRAAYAAFSPDGHTLALETNGDESVSLWDVTNPATPLRNSLFWSADIDFGGLRFSQDGRTLLTNAPVVDEIATLWDLSGLQDLRRAPATVACGITAGGFSPGDWERYIPDIPYRRTC